MTTKREQKEQVLKRVIDALDDTSVAICQARPNTMARVNVCLDGAEYEAFGFSKPMRRDRWDADICVEIATEDALAKIVKAIIAGLELKECAFFVAQPASVFGKPEPVDEGNTCGEQDCPQGFGMPCEACG